MALWCEHLRTVQVPQGDVPRPVTVVLPYYDNPDFFARRVQNWAAVDASVRPWVRWVVVDDGSPHCSAACALRGQVPVMALRIFRILVDVRWNWLAARNLGAYYATTEWVMLTDMDHILPEATLRALVYGRHNPGCLHAFQRRERDGALIHPHSASFFLTRDLFWRIGGYDERLSGYYGTDGDFRRRAAAVAPIVITTDTLCRFEHVGDSSTTTYERKQTQDREVRRLIAKRPPRNWTPLTLSFPYVEEAL